MIRLREVRVERGGKPVLQGVNAGFGAGRLTVVVGPNGAGKSTLLDVAAGLLKPSAGRVELDGADISSLSLKELARRRAYLPQSPRVDWAISVERVVALGLTSRLPAFGALPAVWRPRIDSALERLDLLHLRERPATQLSGGELARVMLARATVGEPEILIVDEPTAGLDPRHALDAGRRLRALADAGCTVVVALHDLDLALRIADEAVAMKDGHVAAEGPAEDIFTDDVMAALYDVPARVRRDSDGASIRFLG
ncbi:ABC transporter ATP-binding protein [Sandaracinobacter sp. RS1-74]|uniref:ABC transporter ATP-binding protein n=1 Tax=Sandaracinobacteroides sayramensis TaxID=2913411 RepID=UPI001EDBBD14|nr:ABC transporter ATP-binding protein [Sandaracinobacteroides sayramensis]MCG2841624.1 ABC transporter ATP-binding protein [Sandaracinobacteroides sayramensis]